MLGTDVRRKSIGVCSYTYCSFENASLRYPIQGLAMARKMCHIRKGESKTRGRHISSSRSTRVTLGEGFQGAGWNSLLSNGQLPCKGRKIVSVTRGRERRGNKRNSKRNGRREKMEGGRWLAEGKPRTKLWGSS